MVVRGRRSSRWSSGLAGLLAVLATACGEDGSGEAEATGTTGAGTSSPVDSDSPSSGSATTGAASDGSTGAVDSTGAGTTTGDTTGGGVTPWTWDLPPGIPEPQVPEDNPMTLEKVELGRHLFYDERLSGNQTMACATCHQQQSSFSDGLAAPLGSEGAQLARNSMSLVNTAYTKPLTWPNPLLHELEDQLLVPIFGESPIELGATGHEEEILQRFRDDPLYQDLFAAAYPDEEDPFTFGRIVQAIASFCRALVSFDSPYDRYTYFGDDTAMSEAAIRGSELFFSETLECHHCHGGLNFSLATVHENTAFENNAFANTGLYNVDGAGAYPTGNQGLIEITFEPDDMGKFRTPTLRNVAVSGPYLHDGSAATLDDVIDIYAAGGRVIPSGPDAGDGTANPHKSAFVTGFDLSPSERADLIAFLESLTDETFLADERYASPFE